MVPPSTEEKCSTKDQRPNVLLVLQHELSGSSSSADHHVGKITAEKSIDTEQEVHCKKCLRTMPWSKVSVLAATNCSDERSKRQKV